MVKKQVDKFFDQANMLLNPALREGRQLEAQKQAKGKAQVQAPPLVQPKPQPRVEEAPKQPKIIRNQDTGKISGVTMPNGDTFLGRDKDIRSLVESKVRQQSTPQGAVEASAVGAQANQIQQNAPLAQQVGQIPETGMPGKTPLNAQETIGGGLSAAIPGVVGGALSGALLGGSAGSVALPGLGTVGGAAAGAIVGGIGAFLAGSRSAMKNQLEEGVSTGSVTIRDSTRNLRALITDTNAHPQNAAENLALFNHQLSIIQQAHSQLIVDTGSDLNKFLGVNGAPELEKYELFYSPGGTRDYLTQQMQLALLNPEPSKVFVTSEDLLDNNPEE